PQPGRRAVATATAATPRGPPASARRRLRPGRRAAGRLGSGTARRRRPRLVRGMFVRRVLPALLVVALLAAAAAITTAKRSLTLTAGASAVPPTAAAVAGVVRACPAPGLA